MCVCVCVRLIVEIVPQIHKWVPVIVPLAYVLVVLHVLVWRRPFSAYHARYPKTDKSGRGIFKRDSNFRS